MGPFNSMVSSFRLAPFHLYTEFYYHLGPFHLREAHDWGVQGWAAPALQQSGNKQSDTGTKIRAIERLNSVIKIITDHIPTSTLYTTYNMQKHYQKRNYVLTILLLILYIKWYTTCLRLLVYFINSLIRYCAPLP